MYTLQKEAKLRGGLCTQSNKLWSLWPQGEDTDTNHVCAVQTWLHDLPALSCVQKQVRNDADETQRPRGGNASGLLVHTSQLVGHMAAFKCIRRLGVQTWAARGFSLGALRTCLVCPAFFPSLDAPL